MLTGMRNEYAVTFPLSIFSGLIGYLSECWLKFGRWSGDMSGNVWEWGWCEACTRGYQRGPWGPAGGRARVIHGGS